MPPFTFRIRPFTLTDLDEVITILQANGQLNVPAVDGHQPLRRVHQFSGAFFLVAEANNRVVGMARGVWDGSRALVHQISVHPDYQRRGIGTALMRSIARRFRDVGAPTLSVTATDDTRDFYKRLGFAPVDVVFMIARNINTVVDEEDNSD